MLVPSIDLNHCPLHLRSSHISGHTPNPGVFGTRESSRHSHSSPLTDTSGRITLFMTSLVPYFLGPSSLLTSILIPIYWALLTPFSLPRLGLKTIHQDPSYLPGQKPTLTQMSYLLFLLLNFRAWWPLGQQWSHHRFKVCRPNRSASYPWSSFDSVPNSLQNSSKVVPSHLLPLVAGS